VLAGILLIATVSAFPIGSRLHEDKACYAILGPVAQGSPVMGATWQSIQRDHLGVRAVWHVIVHQRLSGARFDLRDELVLDGDTLRPISLSSTMNGKPHAELSYGDKRVTGFRFDRQGDRVEIDQALTAAVWDGNLYGPTFAALPLRQGASFAVPFYQYDRGLGSFTLTVRSSKSVATPSGSVEAWVLDAGPSEAERMEYLIAKKDGRALGYGSADGGQRLGGDCSGIN
jgi:hypothetical protein